MTFYMYRSTHDEEYALENANLANIAGSLWYLHNEVVISCPRKFDITRVKRYLITMKGTKALFEGPKHYQFSQFTQFDQGKCTWNYSRCENLWDTYGFSPGCQPLDTNVAAYTTKPSPVWYSLPGRCPSLEWNKKTPECDFFQPGGKCAEPDGTISCTWTSRPAGEISVSELSGITEPFADFCASGGKEYDVVFDKGINNDFWNGKKDPLLAAERYKRFVALFKEKYPSWPATSPEPLCDWWR